MSDHRRRDGPISGRNRVLKNLDEKEDGTCFIFVSEHSTPADEWSGVLIRLCRRVSPEIKSDRLQLLSEHAELRMERKALFHVCLESR